MQIFTAPYSQGNWHNRRPANCQSPEIKLS